MTIDKDSTMEIDPAEPEEALEHQEHRMKGGLAYKSYGRRGVPFYLWGHRRGE